MKKQARSWILGPGNVNAVLILPARWNSVPEMAGLRKLSLNRASSGTSRATQRNPVGHGQSGLLQMLLAVLSNVSTIQSFSLIIHRKVVMSEFLFSVKLLRF